MRYAGRTLRRQAQPISIMHSQCKTRGAPSSSPFGSKRTALISLVDDPGSELVPGAWSTYSQWWATSFGSILFYHSSHLQSLINMLYFRLGILICSKQLSEEVVLAGFCRAGDFRHSIRYNMSPVRYILYLLHPDSEACSVLQNSVWNSGWRRLWMLIPVT